MGRTWEEPTLLTEKHKSIPNIDEMETLTLEHISEKLPVQFTWVIFKRELMMLLSCQKMSKSQI